MSSLKLTPNSSGIQGTSNSLDPARRYCVVAAVLMLSLFLTESAFALKTSGSAPYVPAPDDIVLIRDYPVFSNGLDKPDLQSDHNNPDTAEQIMKIRQYIGHGINHADSQSLGLAQGLINAWQGTQLPLELRVLRATIAQQKHQFQAAIEDLSFVLKRQPDHSQARLIRAAIYLATGNFALAESDCRATALIVDPIVTANCLAQALGPRGQAKNMIDRLDALLAVNLDIDPALKREVLTTQGDLFMVLNDLRLAYQAYAEALEISPQHPYLQAQIRDILIQRGDYPLLLASLAAQQNTLNKRVYQSIAEYKIPSELANSSGLNAVDQTPLESVALLREELRLLDLSNTADTAKYWAAYYFYIEQNYQEALRFAVINWQTQQSLSDARLLKMTATAAKDDDQLSALQTWLKERGVFDLSLQFN